MKTPEQIATEILADSRGAVGGSRAALEAGIARAIREARGTADAPDLFGDVGAFHEKFGLPLYPTAPVGWMDKSAFDFRVKFMQEELDEFQEGCSEKNMEKAADALADLVYVALGTAHLMGIPFNQVWAEVQRANMQKERANGSSDPRSKRAHSLDVVKPAGWSPPDHSGILADAGWVEPPAGPGAIRD